MDAHRFWIASGVASALIDCGFSVSAPDRLRRPATWDDEVTHLLPALPDRPYVLIGGSNGCSVALRLHAVRPATALVLAWPATPLPMTGVPAELIAGETLRGFSDVDISRIRVAVAVVPAEPPNPVHARATVDALLALIPGAVELEGSPEAPRPSFRPAQFVAPLVRWLADRVV
jgi:pimeloyl-ACP methyl ester carboxylesterase